MIGLSPQPGQTRFLVLVPPEKGLLDAVEMIGVAGGSVLATGAISNLLVAHSEEPGFVEGLYRAGAWLVLDGAAPEGCFGPPVEPSARLARGGA